MSTDFIGDLVGGPHDGMSIDIDPRIKNCAIVEGHWYFRVLPTRSLGYGKRFDYQHSAKCSCEG